MNWVNYVSPNLKKALDLLDSGKIEQAKKTLGDFRSKLDYQFQKWRFRQGEVEKVVVNRMRRKRKNKIRQEAKKAHHSQRFAEKLKQVPKKVASLDLEFFEFEQSKITEIGLSEMDTETEQVFSRHIVIKENLKYRNGKHCADNRDHFLFGKSEVMSLEDAVEEVDNFLKRQTFLVGHSIRDDLNKIQKEGVLFREYRLFCTRKFLQQNGNAIGLLKACEENGIKHERPHNAGNDSHVSCLLFAALAKTEKFLDSEKKGCIIGR